MIHEQLKALAVPISSILLDDKNARLHDETNIKAIETSYRLYGQRKPIVVNRRTNKVEAGNGQLRAAVNLGWREIAAIYVDDDASTAAGFAIADNRTAELAEWDDEVLQELIGEIELPDADLQSILEDLAVDVGIEDEGEASPAAEPQVDRAAELQKKWGTETGQLWLIGAYWQCEDCGKEYKYQQGVQMEECPCG